ncbi:MAG TPA: hypothetical protein VF266_17380 [Thermoanaerobaculia bacterium]
MHALAIALFAATVAGTTPPDLVMQRGAEGAIVPVEPAKSLCTCYYGYDEECPRNFVCNQNFTGIGCVRMKPKGGAYGGKCTQKAEQKLVKPCDANCAEKTVVVSECYGEDLTDVARAFELWRRAMTEPAVNGGGMIDANLAAQARALPLNSACIEYAGWRTFAVLELCRGHAITDHSDDDHDELTEHHLADLSNDSCRVDSGNACIAALIAGLSQGPDVVDDHLQGVAAGCGGTLPFEPAGPGYENMSAMDAVVDRLRVTVGYLKPATSVPVDPEPDAAGQRER